MASGQRPRVLVVDDDLTIRATFADVLGGEGSEVTPAPDGREAVRLAAVVAKPPNLAELLACFRDLTARGPA